MTERLHGVAGPSIRVPGRGWVRACLCGREFESHQDWEHVPALFDHLATVPATAADAASKPKTGLGDGSEIHRDGGES
jgi:hypothetical protein